MRISDWSSDVCSSDLVARQRIDIGGKPLMPGTGKADQPDRPPQARRLRSEGDGKGAERGAEHGRLAGAVDAHAPAPQARRQPAARDGPDVRQQIDGDRKSVV